MKHRISIYFFLIFQCVFLCALKATEIESLTPLLEYLIDIAEHHQKEPSQPVPIIAIGGCSGVGKTHFANALASTLQELGVKCRVLQTDHFVLSREERDKIGTPWDERHLKLAELHAFLAAVVSGKKLVEKPTRDQMSEKVSVELFDLNGIDLLLSEGHLALCSDSPFSFFDYCIGGIFIDADESDMRKWRWERDQKRDRPRTPEQFEQLHAVFMREYHGNIKFSKKNAAFVINKDSLHNYHLEVVQ